VSLTDIPSAVQAILLSFRCCFTAPSYQNFVALVTGWILCQGRHSVSRVIQAASGPARAKHHATLYRFLSRAKWGADSLGKVLFRLLLPYLPQEILALVDDTLCRKSGPHLFGAGMHHDARQSTYGRWTSAKAHVSFAFGHSWVVLAVWVPLPWSTNRGLAVPLLFRLYRSKKRCPTSSYRKRTQLAVELVGIFVAWLPKERRLHVIGDSEYASNTVVQSLPERALFTGAMAMDAALYALPGPYGGRGRPRLKGRRLASPKKLATSRMPWQKLELVIYGKTVKLLYKTRICLWYRVAHVRPVRMVVTRDPRGRLQDRAYFTTDTEASVEALLSRYARRWEIEVSFRNAKQSLRVEDPQNGWWRRKHGTRRPKKRFGPHPRGNRGRLAVERTVPLAFTAYAVVVIWSLQHGDPTAAVRQAKSEAPWHTKKSTPSFDDMLATLRRQFWVRRFSVDPSLKRVRKKILALLPRWLLAA